jgi:Raf kinase inhibitor-like YbhB/YbcL family protein
VFENNKPIPVKYTCDGANINPPLTIDEVPKETKTLVLIVDDPDAPMGTFNHWVVWNIPPTTRKIEENTVPGTEAISTSRKQAYGGPCPPYGTHRYFFKVYALDTQLYLKSNSTKRDVEKAMKGHILAEGELMGLYSRH